VTVKIVYLGFLVSYTSRVAPIIQISINKGVGCPLVTSF
jgi:hypothetical protein